MQHLLDGRNQQYGTFNSHRSALPLVLPEDVCHNPLIKRYLKGISRQRPTKPRYNCTWDTKLVLKHLEGTNANELSRKVATLLALVIRGRLQTISLIRFFNIVHDSDKLQIFITDFVKTSLTSQTQPCLHIPFYTANRAICPASILLQYIILTEERWDAQKRGFSFPYNCWTSQKGPLNKQITRWIKQTLTDAGVNTALYKPHSNRHSATSAAYREGQPISNMSNCAVVGNFVHLYKVLQPTFERNQWTSEYCAKYDYYLLG